MFSESSSQQDEQDVSSILMQSLSLWHCLNSAGIGIKTSLQAADVKLKQTSKVMIFQVLFIDSILIHFDLVSKS